jgi:hypothetical protein
MSENQGDTFQKKEFGPNYGFFIYHEVHEGHEGERIKNFFVSFMNFMVKILNLSKNGRR